MKPFEACNLVHADEAHCDISEFLRAMKCRGVLDLHLPGRLGNDLFVVAEALIYSKEKSWSLGRDAERWTQAYPSFMCLSELGHPESCGKGIRTRTAGYMQDEADVKRFILSRALLCQAFRSRLIPQELPGKNDAVVYFRYFFCDIENNFSKEYLYSRTHEELLKDMPRAESKAFRN